MTNYESTSGSIVHVELTSDDVEASRAFFEDAFGWEIEVDEAMDYTIWRPPNPPGGGIMLPQPDGPEGQEDVAYGQPSTLFYVDVEDLAETREAIEAAGGEVLLDEMEVPEMGVFTVFRDPGGVIEAAWENRYEGEPPEGGWPAFTDEPAAGSVTYFELYSEDPDATRQFHQSVFGWSSESVGEGDYTMIRPPTPPYGGVMAANEEMPVGTLLYLLVEDAEAAVGTIEDAGGRILREPFDVEGWGRMAVFEAPGGVVLAAWENVPAEEESSAAEERLGREIPR